MTTPSHDPQAGAQRAHDQVDRLREQQIELAATPLGLPADHDIGDADADQQRLRGFRLVTNGRTIYLTPLVLPGEFPVAEAA